jgi:glutamate dehydrogenase (NADP+)
LPTPPGTSRAVRCEVALPCATQNELDNTSAATLIANDCTIPAQSANMPRTPGAVRLFTKACATFGPGRATNTGRCRD